MESFLVAFLKKMVFTSSAMVILLGSLVSRHFMIIYFKSKEI